MGLAGAMNGLDPQVVQMQAGNRTVYLGICSGQVCQSFAQYSLYRQLARRDDCRRDLQLDPWRRAAARSLYSG